VFISELLQFVTIVGEQHSVGNESLGEFISLGKESIVCNWILCYFCDSMSLGFLL